MPALEGRWQVRKFKKGEDTPFEIVDLGKNTILDGGIQRIVDLMIGATPNASRFNASSILRIYTSSASGTPLQTVNGALEGPTMAVFTAASFTITWADTSTLAYTPGNLRTFFPDNLQLSTTNISGVGSKASTETWLYDYVFNANNEPGEFRIRQEGLAHIIRIMIGQSNRFMLASDMQLTGHAEDPNFPDFECNGQILLGSVNGLTVERPEGTRTAQYYFEVDAGVATGQWFCGWIRFLNGEAENPTPDIFRGFFDQLAVNKGPQTIFQYTFNLNFTSA